MFKARSDSPNFEEFVRRQLKVALDLGASVLGNLVRVDADKLVFNGVFGDGTAIINVVPNHRHAFNLMETSELLSRYKDVISFLRAIVPIETIIVDNWNVRFSICDVKGLYTLDSYTSNKAYYTVTHTGSNEQYMTIPHAGLDHSHLRDDLVMLATH